MIQDKRFIPETIKDPDLPLSAETADIINNVNSYTSNLISQQRESVRTKRNFKIQLNALNSVPQQDRAYEWLRARAILCAAHRQDQRYVRRHSNKIRNFLAQNGRPEEASKFDDDIIKAMYPFMLGGHGYQIPFSRLDTVHISQQLRVLIDRIEEITGCQVFINSGTLLGARRNGSFIPHDDDIDVAIDLGDRTDVTAAAQFEIIVDKLKAGGLASKKGGGRKSKRALIKVKEIGTVEIDVFPAWSRDGYYYVWPHTYGDVLRSDVLPLHDIDIDGVPLPAPSNPDAMIAQNYGPKWNDVNDKFKFNWKHAHVRFDKFISAWNKNPSDM